MRLALLCLLATSPAYAQVTTNDQALAALKPAATAAPAKPVVPAAPARKAVRHPAVRPAHPPARPAPPPQVPLAPPVNPVLLPPAPVLPAHPRPNPPPVPVKADATCEVSHIAGGGTRIVFGPGASTLNPACFDAIAAIAAPAKADPALMISATAWAPGTPDDPSPARMLSLERALAARAVLINAGVVSDRVLAVAKGFEGIGAGPPDRMDIFVAAPRQTPAGSPAPPPGTAVSPGKTPPAKP